MIDDSSIFSASETGGESPVPVGCDEEAFCKPREYCGLCGVSGGELVLEKVHSGLHAQQHRGQECAGVMISTGRACAFHRGSGLVDSVMATVPQEWWTMPIQRAIGHVRYSTAGDKSALNAQPIVVNIGGTTIGIAHNGTICNSVSLRSKLLQEGAIFQTTSDTELVLHLMSRSLTKHHNGDLWKALEEALGELKGAYSLLLMTKDELVAVREPYGFRPLVVGFFDDGGLMVASETIAFNAVGATYLREIEPGEMVIINKNNHIKSHSFATCEKRAHCIFEHVYFARPGSFVFGDSVYEARKEMGRQLAREAPVDADVVIPMPDSGMFAALGYSEQSGIPFDMGITRNHYVGRTFIDPGVMPRQRMVMRKLQPIAEALKGRRICVIEDSIVRGSTSRARMNALRQVGAREIHMRISCPPHRYGCYYGIDFPEREKLFANKFDESSFCGILGLDSLAYLSQEGMLKSVKKYKPEDYCCACFDGKYPVAPEMVDSKGV